MKHVIKKCIIEVFGENYKVRGIIKVMIGDSQTLFITLAFLVPGFILYSTIGFLLPRRKEDGLNLILRYLTASGVNYGIWFWLIYIVLDTPCLSKLLVAGLWIIILFVSPLVLGLTWAWMSNQDILRKITTKLGFNLINSVPTAWDFKFSSCRPVWVLITLNDGSQVAGFWGEGSFVSNVIGEWDIYISRVYTYRNNANLKEVPNSDGIWISGSQIAHIQFFKP